ncbi:MAG: hypothetical protein EGQ26_01950 [Clostridiales bacterium]|nr:hypothetical protein [Clostridiales bacterium]
MINLDPQAIRDYIRESRTGFWKMELRDGAATRMYADVQCRRFSVSRTTFPRKRAIPFSPIISIRMIFRL